MSVQDQYTNTVRQTQEAWTGIVESLTDNTKVFGGFTPPVQTVDPSDAIDQIFDFWAKTLEAEREVFKQIVDASVAVTEQFRSQAEKVGEAVREQAETAQRAIREQAESFQRNERKQAVAKYDELTKGELQDELASRDLPKTGNVDELRARLVADDLK
jgi:hypothetical protein